MNMLFRQCYIVPRDFDEDEMTDLSTEKSLVEKARMAAMLRILSLSRDSCTRSVTIKIKQG